MVKTFILCLLLPVMAMQGVAQIKWTRSSTLLTDNAWENYSTTYISPEDENTKPVLVTAIPYNGIYSHEDQYGLPFSMSGNQSLFGFVSRLSAKTQQLFTYDSSNVYFITPGIHPSNARLYEYRVLLNGKMVITPWTTITQFTDDDFQLNNFKKHLGFLGGYKTTWGNGIVVELRRTGSDSLLASSAVAWAETKPQLLQIYTPGDLEDLLSLLKTSYNPYTPEVPSGELLKWRTRYARNQLDPETGLPKKLVLQPGESSVIFYLRSGVFKRYAIEYQLLKDGKVVIKWQPNDKDNSFIRLKELSHGDYQLFIRYSAQRHNVIRYPFEVEPAWYQTGLFKGVAAFLLVAFISAIYLFYRLIKQQRRTRAAEAKKQQLALELKAIHTQLNPHFIFNSLSSIQGLINTNEIKAANQYLSEFGTLMRNTLTGKDKNFTTLAEDISTIDNYLKLEQLRFGFLYSISTDENIDVRETEVPFLLLQPIVENAVKHGVGGMQDGGVITLTFRREDNNLIASVADNGKGFSDKAKTGYGLKLTRDRITLLNQTMSDRSLALAIEDNVPGTLVKINFINWLL
ncbi:MULTISPECIES: sensor histidine kinase [Niastella]|uniref:Histidine kinase n=1 Tax=Niastella soli TaxID=2821487 RepID=A0ABS3YXI9_9BACT|nr:histidine kinase [Niastella soli]MBO9202569.1 histidine kinase [Niastella soli]